MNYINWKVSPHKNAPPGLFFRVYSNLHTQLAVKILHQPYHNNTLRLNVMTHCPYFPPTQLCTSNLSHQININHYKSHSQDISHFML